MALIDFLSAHYPIGENGIFDAGCEGYWSNLTKEDNRSLLESMRQVTAREALIKHQPQLEEVIYSPKRQAGLELLELSGSELCIDYGCMWGALTVPLARRTRFVLGVDQTLESLQFLNARLKEEGVDNVALLHHDLRRMPVLPEPVRADIAIVNGVLEWVPEVGNIELKSYYGKRHKKKYSHHPGEEQEAFLRRVCENLNDKGKLYLAIENRFDFKMFLGAKDPHSNIILTSLLPKKAADWISLALLGRPYINWTYSFGGLRRLLEKAGFSEVDLYMCFPDYRFPEAIIHYSSSLKEYRPTIRVRNSSGKISVRRIGASIAERIAFKILKIRSIAPSIIAIGRK